MREGRNERESPQRRGGRKRDQRVTYNTKKYWRKTDIQLGRITTLSAHKQVNWALKMIGRCFPQRKLAIELCCCYYFFLKKERQSCQDLTQINTFGQGSIS